MGKMAIDKNAYLMPVLRIDVRIFLNYKLKRKREKEKKINTPQRVDLKNKNHYFYLFWKVGSIPSIRLEIQSI